MLMLPTALKIYLAIEPVDMANSLTDLYQRPLNAGLFGSREHQRVDGSPLAGARGYLANQSLTLLGD
jgi:hypothetical protein